MFSTGEKVSLPLLHPIRKPVFVSLYLVVLYISSSFFWVFLNSIEFLFLKSRQALRSVIAQERSGPENDSYDRSTIFISSDPKLEILVLTPAGDRVGDSLGDLRINQVYSATIEQKLIVKELSDVSQSQQSERWELTLNQPPNGKYIITFSSESGGTYNYHLNVTGSDGTYNKLLDDTIKLEPREIAHYELTYHKDLIYRARLARQRLIDRFLNIF